MRQSYDRVGLVIHVRLVRRVYAGAVGAMGGMWKIVETKGRSAQEHWTSSVSLR